jgi:zinc and cadmium transporter
MLTLIYSLLSVVSVSFISIIIIYYLLGRVANLSRYIVYLVSLAVGTLFGDAFIHLLPEASETIGEGLVVPFLTISGIIIFFILEKIVRWRHCHNPDCCSQEDDDGHHSEHVVANSLAGEVLHNFIDGVIIASSFMVSPSLGVITTVAVLLHEIPQEIGDFAIYVHQGKTLFQALKLNLFTAASSIVGVLFTFLLGNLVEDFSVYMLPVTAGGFIYLASSDLIPEIHRHQSDKWSSLVQVLFILLGVALMASLMLLE